MISKLTAAATLAAAGLVGSMAANALAPNIDPQGVAAAARFYISGSTALDSGFKHYLSLDITQSGGGICKKGTINIFSDATSLNGATEYMVTCQSNVAIGTVAAGANIMVVKDGTGGSLEGTLPLLHAAFARTDYFDVDTGGAGAFEAACTAAVAWNEVGAGKPFPHGDAGAAFWASCGRKTATKTPIVGAADVNAELFNVGLEQISAADAAALHGTPMYQQEFGIAVSLNLYRTLQIAQGKGNTDAAVDMPSLSMQTLRGLFGGAALGGNLTTDWSQVFDDAGNPVTNHDAANANRTAPVAIAPNGATAVYVCRRGDSSGTEASQDAYIFNNRCIQNLLPFASPTTAGGPVSCTNCTAAQCTGLTASCSSGFTADGAAPGTPTACVALNGHTYTMTPQETGCKYVSASNLADTVFAANGTGDVDSCLHDHSKHNAFAVGILSGDRPYDDLIAGNLNAKGGWGGSGDATPAQVSPPQPLNNAASHEWRFVAIDGKKANLESVASGIYDDVWNNVIYTGALGHGANANDQAFQNLLVTGGVNAMTQSTVLVDIQVSQAHGTTGGILEPQATSVPALIPINIATNPVSALSKAWVGNNDCQPAVQFNTSNGVAGIFNRPSDAPAPAGVPAPL